MLNFIDARRALLLKLKRWVRERGRRFYTLLPLTGPQKSRLLTLAYMGAGSLFEGTPNYEIWNRRGALNSAPVTSWAPIAPEQFEGVARSIRVESSQSPLVSFVILSSTDVSNTLNTLRSIACARLGFEYEAVVVQQQECRFPLNSLLLNGGIRYIQRVDDSHTAAALNKAVNRTRGRYLVFVGPDVEIAEGSIDALLRAFCLKSEIGICGSKILFRSGLIKQAGGYVREDGATLELGRMEKSSSPKYNYLKLVDYCSFALLMIDAELYRTVGGLDETMSPVGYGAVDLAFAIREAGMKVVYQPASSALQHDEPRCIEKGMGMVVSDQSHDQHTFTRKWITSSFGKRLEYVRSGLRKTVLIVDQYVPQPDRDAGSRTMIEIVRGLLDIDFEVKFWPQHCWYDPIYTPQLQEMGVDIQYGDSREGNFTNWFNENGADVDFILVSRPDVAREYLGQIRKRSPVPIIYYGHDIHYLRLADELGFDRGEARLVRRELGRYLSLEQHIWRSVDRVCYPSRREADEVARVLASREGVATIPSYAFETVVDNAAENLSERRGILFVGNYAHRPNVTAARFVVSEVLPLVRAVLPDVEVVLAGANPGIDLYRLANDHVVITGYISDDALAEYYGNTRVVVAPLQFGAGVKGKVVEGMRFGVPVITTPVGAQGLEDAGAALGVYATAAEIAGEVVAMMTNDELWRSRSKAGLAYVRRRFSRFALQEALKALFV
ncbi:Glycosyltransferase involved in cell wall bisynthesis [Aromatoleum tolulyticum]|uniref:Glycosyltransferase involved in cell wall bisynthesis n=2 Tax=Aromatoleum tolulyticum TaxID=34027 RepID=A0A1N6UTV0_9RHOO|nr:Glycosyltransferase involved in cell wall bisynthesis [Aromatoleum tolulyticum]